MPKAWHQHRFRRISSIILRTSICSRSGKFATLRWNFSNLPPVIRTAYIICRQVEQASKQLGIELSNATVAVCGATGDIGSAVCRWFDATDVAELLLIARGALARVAIGAGSRQNGLKKRCPGRYCGLGC